MLNASPDPRKPKKAGSREGKIPLRTIAVIALIIVAGAAGYLLGKKSNPINLQTVQSRTTTTAQSLMPSADATTSAAAIIQSLPGWQTYADEQHGFSMEYPSDWTLEPGAFGLALDSLGTLRSLASDPTQSQTALPDDMTIQFSENPMNFPASEYYRGQYGHDFFADPTYQVSTATVGGALSYVVDQADGDAPSYVIIPRDNFFIVATLATDDSVAHQILSTFRFAN